MMKNSTDVLIGPTFTLIFPLFPCSLRSKGLTFLCSGGETALQHHCLKTTVTFNLFDRVIIIINYHCYYGFVTFSFAFNLIVYLFHGAACFFVFFYFSVQKFLWPTLLSIYKYIYKHFIWNKRFDCCVICILSGCWGNEATTRRAKMGHSESDVSCGPDHGIMFLLAQWDHQSILVKYRCSVNGSVKNETWYCLSKEYLGHKVCLPYKEKGYMTSSKLGGPSQSSRTLVYVVTIELLL